MSFPCLPWQGVVPPSREPLQKAATTQYLLRGYHGDCLQAHPWVLATGRWPCSGPWHWPVPNTQVRLRSRQFMWPCARLEAAAPGWAQDPYLGALDLLGVLRSYLGLSPGSCDTWRIPPTWVVGPCFCAGVVVAEPLGACGMRSMAEEAADPLLAASSLGVGSPWGPQCPCWMPPRGWDPPRMSRGGLAEAGEGEGQSS